MSPSIHFWHAVLSEPDDKEADRMMKELELYERQQWEAEEEAARRRLQQRIKQILEERAE